MYSSLVEDSVTFNCENKSLSPKPSADALELSAEACASFISPEASADAVKPTRLISAATP